MIDSNFIKKSKLSIQNVSRETLDELNAYSSSIINKNKEINLISSSTEKSINIRHIVDSAQTIDFIDKNEIKICTDLGYPKSVHILISFLSIKSIVCALSTICLIFIDFSVDELMRFISLFLLIIEELYALSSSNVSRETF